MEYSIEILPKHLMASAQNLLKEVFEGEQGIPARLHVPDAAKQPVWWCIRSGFQVVGVAAGWVEENGWHWGRFAVDKSLRGRGLGKKLAVFSLGEIFSLGAKQINIDARDITVGIIKNLGGTVTGEPMLFYEDLVTPMLLTKAGFMASKGNNAGENAEQAQDAGKAEDADNA